MTIPPGGALGSMEVEVRMRTLSVPVAALSSPVLERMRMLVVFLSSLSAVVVFLSPSSAVVSAPSAEVLVVLIRGAVVFSAAEVESSSAGRNCSQQSNE